MGLLRTRFKLTCLWVSQVHGRQGTEQMYDYVTTLRAEKGQGMRRTCYLGSVENIGNGGLNAGLTGTSCSGTCMGGFMGLGHV
jgi:hypothetical protein